MGAKRRARRTVGMCAATLAVLAASAFAAVPAAAQMIYTELPDPGETFVTSCERLPLHAEPDAYAPIVEIAEFGDGYVVEALAGKYLLPKSTRYSETHDYDFDDSGTGKQERDKRDYFYAWLEVRVDGGTAYASTRCMLSQDFHNTQTYEQAERKFEQAAVAKGGKGFSLKPASGGSGKGFGGELASASSDPQAVEALLQRTSTNPYADHESFRKNGQLGEFARAQGDATLRTRPARDFDRPTQGEKDVDQAVSNLFE